VGFWPSSVPWLSHPISGLSWITRIYGPGDTVRIESLDAAFLMDEIYERIRFKQ
jgi:hypothetical protein